jgi:hypothetical protein
MLPQTVSSEQNSGIGLALARGLRNNPPRRLNGYPSYGAN